MLGAKAAVTDRAAVIEMVHVGDVPEQAPPQPENLDPDRGVAVIVIRVRLAKVAEHVDPQAIPAGADVTLPEPVPDLETARS
jgi:hypothetical protein